MRDNKTYDISTGTSLGQIRRRIVAYLSVLILSFNVFAIGALPAHMGNAAFSSGPNAESQGLFVICTSTGMVALDKNGAVPSGPGAGHNGLCVFCLPLLHGDVTLPAPVAKIDRPKTVDSVVLASLSDASAKTLSRYGDYSPRAPPLA